MTIDQQVALEEALVPYASRLRIRKSNFHLKSDNTSKESTLQLVYDVLRVTPFYKAFLVTVDVPEIYMQEFWATATVHHHSMRFKMDNRKRIVNLEYFKEMMHICLRLHGQTFDELPFEEEILAFLRFLGHSGEIRKLTDAHILWGMYHKKNIDFSYLLLEDFVYQVEHKDAKKSNKMYYPRNSEAYKEYYAVASGATPPKTKASVKKTKSSSNTTITPPTAAGTKLLTFAKGKQPAKASKAKSLTVLSKVAMNEAEQMKLAMKRSLQQTHISQASEISWNSNDDDVDERSDDQDNDNDQDDDDDQEDDDQDEETKDEESFDLIAKTPENLDDECNDDASLDLNVESEEGRDAEDDKDELYRDVNINLEGKDSSSVSSQFVTSMLNPSPDVGIDSLFKTTPQMNVPASTTVASLTLTAPTLPPPTIPTKVNFSEFVQTNQFARAVSSILGIVQRYMDQRMNKAVKVAIQIQSDRLRDEAQAENEEFLKNLVENIQKIIKEQVKEQVKQADSHSSFNELMDTPVDFSTFQMNRLKVDTLIPELLAGLTYELMKGSCKSLVELKFFLEEVYKATTNQLDWNNPEGQQYPHNLLKPLPLIPNSRGRCVIPFDHFINNDLEYLRGGASSCKYTTSVTKTKATDYGHIKWIEDLIVEWHNYKHLDWIAVRRDNDKLYKFKEGNFKRLRIQDIEDMLLLLVQGKLTNLTVEERFAFNVSLRMFTRSIVIQRRVEDLQLGVESYQKKLNLTNSDTYRSDLKHKEAYTAYSNPKGFIYQNKDKQNRKSDKERAAAMIQAIAKQLKTKRIMRSLEKFVGGRLYEGDFRMLQRTI
uniref:Uncharacterized protein n=1 Tax=Tanacetum cinerariifolium TaxID=118510 RepID=A0A6L2JI37_TANCI|nr:hypothetical protein [Tanacetum cinerariifolium]